MSKREAKIIEALGGVFPGNLPKMLGGIVCGYAKDKTHEFTEYLMDPKECKKVVDVLGYGYMSRLSGLHFLTRGFTQNSRGNTVAKFSVCDVDLKSLESELKEEKRQRGRIPWVVFDREYDEVQHCGFLYWDKEGPAKLSNLARNMTKALKRTPIKDEGMDTGRFLTELTNLNLLWVEYDMPDEVWSVRIDIQGGCGVKCDCYWRQLDELQLNEKDETPDDADDEAEEQIAEAVTDWGNRIDQLLAQ